MRHMKLGCLAFTLAACASSAGSSPQQDLAGFFSQDLSGTSNPDFARSNLDLAGVDGSTTMLYPPPTTLTAQTTGGGDLYAIWNSPTNKIYIVGAGGTILSGTSVVTLSAQTSGTTQNLNGVWGSSDTDIYAVGNAGVILHSAGDGTWSPQALPIGLSVSELDQVWGLDATHVYSVGSNGVVLFNDGGGWQLQQLATTKLMHAVYATSPTQILAVGQTGTIFSSAGAGTWTQESEPSNHDIWNIHALNAAAGLQVVCAAGSGTTLRSTDGESWTYASGVGDGNDLRALYLIAGGFIMAGDDGQVAASIDGGATSRRSARRRCRPTAAWHHRLRWHLLHRRQERHDRHRKLGGLVSLIEQIGIRVVLSLARRLGGRLRAFEEPLVDCVGGVRRGEQARRRIDLRRHEPGRLIEGSAAADSSPLPS